jgi:hypothetical protein
LQYYFLRQTEYAEDEKSNTFPAKSGQSYEEMFVKFMNKSLLSCYFIVLCALTSAQAYGQNTSEARLFSLQRGIDFHKNIFSLAGGDSGLQIQIRNEKLRREDGKFDVMCAEIWFGGRKRGNFYFYIHTGAEVDRNIGRIYVQNMNDNFENLVNKSRMGYLVGPAKFIWPSR